MAVDQLLGYMYNESTAGADASVEASYNVASYAGLPQSLHCIVNFPLRLVYNTTLASKR